MVDPRSLIPAPWNPNRATPEDQLKLDASIERLGMFKPVICRELPDGSLQILGGHWRCDSAIRLGWDSIPVVNLGTVSDERAKEITLVDNGRYGQDDAGLLADLLKELGTPQELAAFMPYDMIQLEAIAAASRIDLDTLGLDEEDDPAPEKKVKPPRTHEVMKFRVDVEDVGWIGDMVKAVVADEGLTDQDAMTAAGAALSILLNRLRDA